MRCLIQVLPDPGYEAKAVTGSCVLEKPRCLQSFVLSGLTSVTSSAGEKVVTFLVMNRG